MRGLDARIHAAATDLGFPACSHSPHLRMDRRVEPGGDEFRKPVASLLIFPRGSRRAQLQRKRS
jgi:hypothetical protein